MTVVRFVCHPMGFVAFSPPPFSLALPAVIAWLQHCRNKPNISVTTSQPLFLQRRHPPQRHQQGQLIIRLAVYQPRPEKGI